MQENIFFKKIKKMLNDIKLTRHNLMNASSVCDKNIQ